MSRQPQHALSEPTRSLLAQFGHALKGRTMPRDLLDEALTQLGALPPEVVVRADREIATMAQLLHEHRATWERWRPGFWPRGSSYLALLAMTPRLEQLFIFHRDGHLREAALKKLDGALDSAFLVAAVALRLNDWVAQVRVAAEACAERTFPRTDARVLARALLFLIGRTARWQRWSQEPAVIAASLAKRDVAAALADLFRTGEFGGVARTFRQALRRPEMDGYLPDLASQARQPAVRAMALEALIEGRATWIVEFERQWIDKVYGKSRRRPVLGERPIVHPISLEALIDQGLADRSRAVRRVAADGVVQHRATLPGVAELAQRLLADRSPGVRGRGEFLLSREGMPRRTAAPNPASQNS